MIALFFSFNQNDSAIFYQYEFNQIFFYEVAIHISKELQKNVNINKHK